MTLCFIPNPTTIDLTLPARCSSVMLTRMILVLHLDCGAVSSPVQTTLRLNPDFMIEFHGDLFFFARA
jgi:hypothetical protein